MTRALVDWHRSTIGWRPEGTVLYVEHHLADRAMVTFVPALQAWLEEQPWGVAVTRSSGARRVEEDTRTRYIFGMLELVGPRLMHVVDHVLLRANVDRLAAAAELLAQQQIDQDEKHRDDFLAALPTRPRLAHQRMTDSDARPWAAAASRCLLTCSCAHRSGSTT
jgi:hypothetical protein